jgi:DNA-binding sugar fermentation-stimulating protein
MACEWPRRCGLGTAPGHGLSGMRFAAPLVQGTLLRRHQRFLADARLAAGTGFFPDSPSERARRHVRELAARVRSGGRAAVVFCVQRQDVVAVRAADHIHPAFGHALREAATVGVALHALDASITPEAIALVRRLPVCL